MSEIDESLVDWLAGGAMSEDFEFNMKERELKKDFRVNKNKYTDINGEFRDFANFQRTDEYTDTLKAKALLSDQWDTNIESLKETLTSTYKMSDQDCNKVIRNLANSKDVECHKNDFTNNVTLRRKLV